MWPVWLDCTTSPFRRVSSLSLRPGSISSAVTIQGPKAPVSSKFLPEAICLAWNCHSRTLASL